MKGSPALLARGGFHPQAIHGLWVKSSASCLAPRLRAGLFAADCDARRSQTGGTSTARWASLRSAHPTNACDLLGFKHMPEIGFVNNYSLENQRINFFEMVDSNLLILRRVHEVHYDN